MPLDFPFVATRTKKGTRPEAPFQYALVAWYRFRRGVVNTNGGVSSWSDATSNFHPLLQATANNRPSIMSDGALLFNGASQYLQATFTLAQPFMFCVLFKQVSWTLNDVVFDGVTADTKLTQTAATPALTMNGGSSLTASTVIPVGSYGACLAAFSGTDSRFNAAGGGPITGVTGDAGSNAAGGFTLGADRAGSNAANIAVREVLIYNSVLDGSARRKVLRYLASVAGTVGGA